MTKDPWIHMWDVAWDIRGYKEQLRKTALSKLELFLLSMAGGTEVGEGNDGKGKGVVKVSGDGLEGVVLRGKGNGLSVRWAELVKGGNIKLLGAYEVCQRVVGLKESLAQKG